MSIRDIDSGQLATRIARGWLWVFLLATVGGVVGLGVSMLRPPMYAASAVLGIGIDYGRTLPLDDRAEQAAMDRVRALLLSDETLEAALISLRETEYGSGMTLRDFRQAIRLEEMRSEWNLTAYAESPELAARIANAWADGALAALDEAVQHAWRAAALQAELFGLGCRLEPAPSAQVQPAWVCSLIDAGPAAESTLSQLLQEARLSRGVLPTVSAALLRQAVTPSVPALWGRGGLILAGMAFGWVAGVLVAAWKGEAYGARPDARVRGPTS